MNLYQLVQRVSQNFDPEWVHTTSLAALTYLPKWVFSEPKKCPVQILGQTFPHRVGLSAGFDVSGAYLDALSKLGFAFIEVGTVTPKPQTGNAKPRLFRLPEAKALINRMGFNNPGVDVLLTNLQATNYNGILGINIGKNKTTPLNNAIDDYVYCMEKVYVYADYLTINISSPNTEGLRELQNEHYFANLLQGLITKRTNLAKYFQRYVPILIKISPDESDAALERMAKTMLHYEIDGIIATNTTISRTKIQGMRHATEPGGLSGLPLSERSLYCLKLLKNIAGNNLVIISVGGIDSMQAIQQRLTMGADLVQIYTGLVYNGLFF